MALPTVLVDVLKAIPAKNLEHLCSMAKVEYKGSKLTSRTLIKIFEEGDTIALKSVYHGIAPILMVGGMLPGVGLACNIIDAAFCFTIGAWLDFAIDAIAIALFEVPGVSGLKGVSKGMLGLCKSIEIDVKAFWKIMDKLKKSNILKENKVHQLFAFLMDLMDPSNKKIVFVDFNAISKSLSKSNIFEWRPEILTKVAKELEAVGEKAAKKIGLNKNYTIKTPTQVTNHNLRLLDITMRTVK